MQQLNYSSLLVLQLTQQNKSWYLHKKLNSYVF